MTGTAQSEPKRRTIVIDTRAIDGSPRTGGYLSTPSGRVVYRILQYVNLRRAGASSTKPRHVRLSLERVNRADIPKRAILSTIVADWRPAKASPSGPAIASEPASPSDIRARKKRDTEAQHRRAKALLADDRDRNRQVASIRTRTIAESGKVLRRPTAEMDEWVDPEDRNPLRRHARKIAGYRANDAFMEAYKRNTLITKQHKAAAQRLRRDYEVGVAGARVGFELMRVDSSNDPDVGHQEIQFRALRRFENAREAVGPTFAVIQHVVLDNKDIHKFGRLGRQAMGYLVAALDQLVSHYDPPESKEEPS